jgi:hypothetical protein
MECHSGAAHSRTLWLIRTACCKLICRPRKHDLLQRPRQTGTTGKSFLIFRNRVKPGNQKYSAFVLRQIIGITPPVSPN